MMDHLVNHKEDSPTDMLGDLADKARLFQTKKAKVDQLEADLKKAKEEFNEVSQVMIPEAMLPNGLKSIELEDGCKIAVKEDVSASVSDPVKFGKWLSDRGDGDIMKTTLEIGKVPSKIVWDTVKYMTKEYGITPDVAQKVHPQTLNKYVREMCGINGGEAVLSVDDFEGMLSLFVYYKTTIKKGK